MPKGKSKVKVFRLDLRWFSRSSHFCPVDYGKFLKKAIEGEKKHDISEITYEYMEQDFESLTKVLSQAELKKLSFL